ncbi:MAG: pantoate--beta-alanine ligase [bacterium]|nr:pantoate--beta-alanine ligase [bacterium]
MRVVTTPGQMQKEVEALRGAAGRPVGLVPTMGAFHEGHLSLIRRAKNECRGILVSIFVNPAQFGPGEDLSSYPQTFDADIEACRREGVHLVYAPMASTMYPEGFGTWVEPSSLAAGLCGPFRPGHFRGVVTVVAKLLTACRPDRAYFGEKDYQQLMVIRRMAEDLDLGIEIVPCPTVREKDGLAMSSRNAYLGPEDRARALSLYRGLSRAAELFAAGERKAVRLIAAVRKELDAAGLDAEYIQVVDARMLRELDEVRGPARVALAVRVGRTRLIDNIPLEPA